MPGIENSYERILNYLKGLLSNRERHDLEQEMMRDVFDEEAFDGLSQLTSEELKADMEALMNRLDTRLESGKTRKLTWVYRIAAACLVLIGIGSVLYIVLRTPLESLITQETKQPVKETPITTVPVKTPESEAGEVEESVDIRKPAQASTRKEAETKPVAVEEPLMEEIILPEGTDVEEYETEAPIAVEKPRSRKVEQLKYNAIATEKKAEAISIRGISSQKPGKEISGKVVDSQGQPLTGVTVLIKGTTQGTVTDVDGRFALQASDTNPVLALSYIGYMPLELNMDEVTDKEIAMTEDVVALNEVVVVGYGTQKKATITGAVTTLEAKDISEAGDHAPYNYIKPIPPGGTMKAFRNWVESRLDYEQFSDYHGKYRIQVNLSVYTNGTIGDIVIKKDIPSPIAEEYKRVISQSSVWQPALRDNVPVEAEVVIRFVLVID